MHGFLYSVVKKYETSSESTFILHFCIDIEIITITNYIVLVFSLYDLL